MGLMGGSLGLAAKRRGVAESVWGYSRRESSRRAALERGAVDRIFDRPEEAVEGADIVVLCVPILQIPGLVRQCAPHLCSGCVVTDVGSTKAELVKELGPFFDSLDASFVGSHPIAGSEETGVQAAREDLYEDSLVVVTPRGGEEAVPGGPVGAVSEFWKALGARVFLLSPEQHDTTIARTSHLPHLVASMLVACVGRHTREDVGPFCGPGFRDTTRIAAGSKEVWHDIVKSNRQAVADELAAFSGVVDRVRKLVEDGNFEDLKGFLEESSRLRRNFGGGSQREPQEQE